MDSRIGETPTIDENLRRLLLLRSITIGGGVTAVAVELMRESSALVPLTVIVAGLTAFNLTTWLRWRRRITASDWELFLQLLVDVAAFTGLVYFAGGATSPFVWLYFLPLVISATVLPRAFTWAMAGVTIGCYSALMFVNGAFSGPMAMASGFPLHILGMWFAFVLGAGLVAHFVVGMASSLRERDRRLAEARELALRDERLVALGTLAAGAAHELGTPLGTMAIIAGELIDDYSRDGFPALHAKLDTFRTQLQRCREALGVISASAGEVRAQSAQAMAPDAYLEEVISRWRIQRPGVRLSYRVNGPIEGGAVLADRASTQALINVLDNAADASDDRVEVDAWPDTDALVVEVRDRGPGLELPLVAPDSASALSGKEFGLGVGLFLSHATIRRMGGEVSHREREGGGTCTRILLPLLERAAAS